jgi:predicted permease
VNRLRNLMIGLKSLWRKDRVEDELDEELKSFVEASEAHKRTRGMSAEAAHRAAMVEVGSGNAVKHQVWSSRWESGLEGVLQDAGISLRILRKSPSYTIIALLSLALGIGANTAIFTLINQVMLRKLAVSNPDQLVTFGTEKDSGEVMGIDLGAYGMFPWYFARRLEQNPGPFDGIAYFCSFADKVAIRLNNYSDGPALLARANLVSGNFFQVLKAQPLLGRTLTPSDDAQGTNAVIVVSQHFWKQWLSSDPAVLGQTLRINGTPFSVVGVMPDDFYGIRRQVTPPDLWAPMSMQTVILKQPSMLTPGDGMYFLNVFARLSNQSALAQSENWLNGQIRADIRLREGAHLTPDRVAEINRFTVPVLHAARGASSLRDQYGDSLKMLMAVVALVLLIACANLANFLLARAATRKREIATRLALGSSRARIVRQSLIETSLLSLTGAVLGLGVAFAATRVLIGFVSRGKDYIAMDPRPDMTVLLFTLGLSLFSGLLFGLAPAVATAHIGAAGNLSAGSRTGQSSGGKTSRIWAKLLVSAQVMFSLLLLIGAGLFLRTLRNLQNQDFGFERSHLLVAEMNPRLAGYKPSQTPELHQRLLDRLSALPGVRSVALSLTPPISPGHWSSDITIPGYTPAPKENRNSILNRVSGQYFQTAGIPLVSGRPINDADTASSLKVAVINQRLAKHFFPKGDALGRSLKIDMDSAAGPWQIVGITRDTQSTDPRDTEVGMMTYIPLSQIVPYLPVDPKAPKPAAPEENQDRFAGTILVRTEGDPAQTIGDLRAAVASVDPDLPLIDITTMQDQLSNFLTHDELISSLTGLFALLALLLAAIGLYGVMSYNVARRTNEIGVRIALGAEAGAVRWMVVGEALQLLVIGVTLGLPLALLVTRYVKDQLFGLSALDPVTFAVAFAAVSVMTLVAAWVPAMRAAKVEPVVALRCD